MYEERRAANNYGIYSLWANWALALGLLVGVVLLSLVLPKLWLPLAAFIIASVLFSLVRYNRDAEQPGCFRLPYLACWSLVWSAAIMMIINLMHMDWIFGELDILDNANTEIPYITVLIIAPVTFVVTLWSVISGPKSWFCQDCQIRYGTAAERGFLGTLFNQEGEYQSRTLMYMSLFLSITEWGYYFFFYINFNLNSPDKFFYVWMPVIFYVLSLLYLGFRYAGLWTYYCQNIEGSTLRNGSTTLLRFLIVNEDRIFLHTPDTQVEDVRPTSLDIDTPASVALRFKRSLNEFEAETYFKGLSGISGSDLRFIYVNTNFNTEYNIFHYACFVEDPTTIEQSRLKGDWYTLAEVEQLLKTRKASPVLGSELNRIYTVAMAWKKYDRNGNRLYKTKNYQPTFDLRDFKDWTVDFNDKSWLYVALNNEDRPFFRIRRFWRRHVNGI